jgi:hypothetical protein
MHLIQFKAEEIDKVWPLVKDKVQDALDRNHNFRDNQHVKENCKNGIEQLWVIVDNKDDIHGVCITQVVQHPNYNIGTVRMATGHDYLYGMIKLNTLKSGHTMSMDVRRLKSTEDQVGKEF